VDANSCGGVYALSFYLLFLMFLIFGSMYFMMCMAYIRKFGYIIECIEKSALILKKVLDFKTLILMTKGVMFLFSIVFIIVLVFNTAYGQDVMVTAPLVYGGKIITYELDVATRVLFVIQIINIYIIFMFIQNLQEFMVSYAVSSWYFTK
jgi:hypothetical protein